MREITGIVLALLLCAAAARGQPGMRHERGMHRDGPAVSMVRHRFVRRHGLDAPYAGKVRPRAPTADDVAKGEQLFERHCASCHGLSGAGDGEAGAALSPPPADVAFASRRPMATDAYLFWTIAEGGAPVGSGMPPFKGVLGEDETWQLIAYLRVL